MGRRGRLKADIRGHLDRLKDPKTDVDVRQKNSHALCRTLFPRLTPDFIHSETPFITDTITVLITKLDDPDEDIRWESFEVLRTLFSHLTPDFINSQTPRIEPSGGACIAARRG